MEAAATSCTRRLKAAGVVLCVSACAALASPASAKTWTVKIVDMRFVPGDLTVARDDTIVWVNSDLVAHTVTSTSTGAGAFDSHAIAPGGQWRYRANTAGHWTYRCTFHPTMQAQLIVKERP